MNGSYGPRRALPSKPRRCIFFAGWSRDGTVDEADRNYLIELARFGDVFALYDNETVAGDNVDAISAVVKLLLARKHGEYDFGSWKRLYDHLGGEAVEDYDELLFVNNSVVVVAPMDALFDFRYASRAPFFSVALLDEDFPGPDMFISDFLMGVDRFSSSVMFPSIFWSMRRALVRSHIFKHFMRSIELQKSRLDVCHRYERGFSRSLWRHGIETSTFIDRIYPVSFLYTVDAFHLVNAGVPFIKRKALAQDFYPIEFLDERINVLVGRCEPAFRGGLQQAIAASSQTEAVM